MLTRTITLLTVLALAGCNESSIDTVSAPQVPCGPIGVLPDAPNEFELQWGVTNSNAALGQGGLTATLSACGEVTSLKWPGPSYYDQIDYLADNAPDARLKPHYGALEGAGAFGGIAYETANGNGFTWLRDDDAWVHTQRYLSDHSDVVRTTMTNQELGLEVVAEQLIVPGRGLLVNHFDVSRRGDSPVTAATLIFYTNFAPTVARLAFFQIADWALDFENDFGLLYDDREHAMLQFLPQSASTFPHDFTVLNQVLQNPPSGAALQASANAIIDGLSEQGIYIAFGARGGDDGFQAGFDDTDVCTFQSVLADRTISVFGLSDAFADIARSLFQCDRVIQHPDGPLAQCRAANGWTYNAASAYDDAADGQLSGSPIAGCQANGALARRLTFAGDHAEATFDVAIAGRRDDAYALLRGARAESVATQRQANEDWWTAYLTPARLPQTDDEDVLTFARRSLIVMRQAIDNASGAIVASVNAQPPYGADWPRDGAFINYALDIGGYPDAVTAHNRFYARVQRKEPGSWSILYDFPACDPALPAYPDCIPAGTFEQNYYADPDEVIPALTTSFEIDQASVGVWTMWEHAAHIANANERAAYLDDVCPSIALGAINLAACKDASNNLQCFANEDDNIPLTQGLHGAESVWLALNSAVAAALDCGFDPADAESWRVRADELGAAIDANFFESEPIPHYAGARMAWLIWPVGYLTPDNPVTSSHAEFLRTDGVDPILNRTALSGAYNAEPLLVLAQLARQRGDQAELAKLQDDVRFFIHNLTTRGTGLMAEGYGRVSVDLNGDGITPDYWPQNDVPHVWEHSYLYSAAMVAFGSE